MKRGGDESTRVVFVPLAAVGNAALAPAAIAEGFGFSDTTIADLPRRVRVVCQNRATLYYYMLETVRAYATLELAVSGERDDTLEGLVCCRIRRQNWSRPDWP